MMCPICKQKYSVNDAIGTICKTCNFYSYKREPKYFYQGEYYTEEVWLRYLKLKALW